MILTFHDQGTEDVFDGKDSKAARKVCPPDLQRRARAKLFLLDDADTMEDLKIPPSNHLEALQRDRKGQHSIRINRQYRICFRWTEGGVRDAEIVDDHP
ncbi:MAG: type II toxin-antitoxin system RelE/ParE family toxin [Thermodesulfobacteriota bacterium]